MSMQSVQARAKEAWRRFVSVGALDDYLLRPEVFRAWERCHLLGANPRKVGVDSLSTADTVRLLDANAPLLRAAHPYLNALSWSARAQRHAVMLADRNAVTLDVRGDPESVNGPEAVPLPGTLLAEAFAGANGIGTAIAERSYVELARTEHFIGTFHPFTCQGIPIYGSDGALAGCLSVSLRTPSTDVWMRALLFRAAKGIHSALVAARLKDELKAVLAEASPVARADAVARLRTTLAALAAPGSDARPRETVAADREDLIVRARAAMARYEKHAHIRELACRGTLVAGTVARSASESHETSE